jgi:hypothetical protein
MKTKYLKMMKMTRTMMGNTLQFKCPVCNRLHGYNKQHDNLSEVTCPDNESSSIRKINGHERTDLLSDRQWNMNKYSTRVSDYTNNLEIDAVFHKPHPKNVRNW